MTDMPTWLMLVLVALGVSRTVRADLDGLSLVLVRQVLWDVGPLLGHNPPTSAVEFAEQFSPAWRELATRMYTNGIAMVIGDGAGLIAALVALGSGMWRIRRGGRATPTLGRLR